ncbi:MAG TPA: VOC family protein [Xanthomonadaceae bacterium]|nr:VOC family protein [Xanthomonadaceae bacterium]
MSIHLHVRLAGLVLVFVLASGRSAQAEAEAATPGPSLIGLDHIPTVVADLDQASNTYRRLGFSLKPGRSHENGLRNHHVKFRDGSGIELISPPTVATDPLTRQYLDHLHRGDGPVYLSFHARDTSALVAALESSAIGFEGDRLITLTDPLLDYIFFVRDNRSPTDRPEHFAHPNSATAMTGVWLALNEASRASLGRLLVALGAVATEESVFAPDATRAEVYLVQNGRIVVLPKAYRTHEGRPIVGAEFRVEEPGWVDPSAGSPDASGTGASGPRHLLSPSEAHGIWLDFRGRP